MDKQSQPYNPGVFIKKKQNINNNCPRGVKGMKINTASPWVKDWVCNKMINVN